MMPAVRDDGSLQRQTRSIVINHHLLHATVTPAEKCDKQ
jgi:hypothetical protein